MYHNHKKFPHLLSMGVGNKPHIHIIISMAKSVQRKKLIEKK